MKNRTVLITIVCGAIVFMGLLLSAGRHVMGLGWLGGFGSVSQIEVGFGSTPKVNGIAVDTSAKVEGDQQLEAFQSVALNTGSAKVKLIPSDRYRLKYCYYTDLHQVHFENQNGTLKVWDNYNEKYCKKPSNGVSMSGNWNFPDNYVELYYPAEASFESVSMENSFGDAQLGAVTAKTLTLALHSGDASIVDVQAKNINITCDFGDLNIRNEKEFLADNVKIVLHSGDLSMTRLSSAGDMVIEADFGDVTLKELKAASLQTKLHSGDLQANDVNGGKTSITADFGSLHLERLTTSQLTVESSSGDVKIAGNLGGKTEIGSQFGDVALRLNGAADTYHYDLSVNFGDLKVDGKTIKDKYGEDVNHAEANKDAANTITVNNASGDINLQFAG